MSEAAFVNDARIMAKGQVTIPKNRIMFSSPEIYGYFLSRALDDDIEI